METSEYQNHNTAKKCRICSKIKLFSLTSTVTKTNRTGLIEVSRFLFQNEVSETEYVLLKVNSNNVCDTRRLVFMLNVYQKY